MPCALVVMRIFAGPKGASKELIDRLPLVNFDKAKAQAAARQDESIYACAICMESYVEGERILVMPCAHQFHKKCVRTWLGISKTCPTCRADVSVAEHADAV